VGRFAEQLAAHVVRRVVVVNAPRVVNMLGGLGRAVMPAKLREKLLFAKGDGLRDNELAEELGGRGQLEKLYATRQGLVESGGHLEKALEGELADGLPTEEELALVAQLREAHKEELERRRLAGTLHECFFGDLALTRVLRGNQGSLPQAVEWLGRSLWVMAEAKVDGIVADVRGRFEASGSPLGSAKLLPFHEEVGCYARFEFSAPQLTPRGDSVFYMPMSDYDRWGIMQELDWEKWVAYARASIVLRCLELDGLSRAQGRLARCVLLVDLADCSLDTLSCKSFDQANDRDCSKFAEAVSAGIFGRIIVVNPSWAVSTLYSLFGAFIPPHIMRRLQFQRGDCAADAEFAESVGGQEQLQRLLSSRQNLVAANGNAQRALTAELDDRLPSERECLLLAKLRETFKDEFERRRLTGTLHDCFFGDLALARVLRGNGGELQAAKEWFGRFLLKAAEYGLDSLVERVRGAYEAAGTDYGNLTMLPHHEEVHPFFRCVFTAPRPTPRGDVIWYMPLSDIDRAALAERVKPEHFVQFMRALMVLRCLEAERLSRAQGRLVKVYALLDLEGSGASSTGLPSAPAFDALHAAHVGPFMQEMCAEVLAPSYVLNAPWLMVKAFNWFSALVPERLSRKLKLLDGDGSDDAEFLALVGEAQLRFLRGSRVGLLEGLEDEAEGQREIAAGEALEKRRDVAQGQRISWRFSVLAGYDSFLGVSDLDFGATALWLPEPGEALGEELEEQLLPERTVTAADGEICGSLLVPRAGVVTLRWSNGHSVLRAKNLRFAVHVAPAGEEEPLEPPA